jgi:hypothetical protein
MPRVVDPGEREIAWVPDENCYRLVERRVERATVGGNEVAVEVSEFGEQVVWVDDAPGNIEDGSGHFEVYAKSNHGDEYRASVPAPDAAPED